MEDATEDSAMGIGPVETLLGQPLLADGPERRVLWAQIPRPGARDDEHGDAGADRPPQHVHGVKHRAVPWR